MLFRSLIRGKLEDGQLSDCDLSLHDIDQICDTYSEMLKGVYHDRIEYPKVEKFTVKGEAHPNPAAETAGPAKDPEKQAEPEGEVTEEKKEDAPAPETVPEPVPEPVQEEKTEEQGEADGAD